MALNVVLRAGDLDRWASRIESRHLLPVLIRRLIHATVGDLQRLAMRGFEGVGASGWDGIVKADAVGPHVPEGVSGWEIGTGKDAETKASGDYKNRTDDPLDLVPADSAFVFVTPREWHGKLDWAKERESKGPWKHVRVVDAHDIELWLEAAPAVSFWLARVVGNAPTSAQDLQSYWEAWSQSTSPTFSPGLCLADRSEEQNRTTEWLNSPPTPLVVRGDSWEEALAFFAAVVVGLPGEQTEAVLARSVVVHEPAAWRELQAHSTPLTLIPAFRDPAGIEVTTSKGHHVLVPVGNDAPPGNLALELARPRRVTLRRHLVEMGVAEAKAGQVAADSGRSILVIRRALAATPGVATPPWALPTAAGDLVPALLAGAWDEDCEEDVEAIASLAGEPYETYVGKLSRLANDTDAPVHQIGTVWRLTSRRDSWNLLRAHISSVELSRLATVAKSVLQAADTSYDLDLDDRWLAGIRGKGASHSRHLRTGMAETLALLGALSGAERIGGRSTGQEAADSIVRESLGAAADWRAWASISDLLPILAEAAPDVFLDHVQRALQGDGAELRELFAQEGGMFGSSPHVPLLWALEMLIWSPDHAGLACLALARLSRLDPGGQLTNRPQESLHTAFCSWCPQTALDLTRRMKVIDSILQRELDAGWRLLCDLLPEHRGVSTSVLPQPQWRDWEPEPTPSITGQEYLRTVCEIVERALKHATLDGDRWVSIVEHLPDFPPAQCDQAIETLSSLDLAPADAAKVWHALRSVVHEHRAFPDADWAMPAEMTGRLAECYEQFTPVGPVESRAWLFASSAELPDPVVGDDFEAQDRQLAEERKRAVGDIHAAGGTDLIFEAALRVEQPGVLGYSLGMVDIDGAIDGVVIERAVGAAGALVDFAIGYVGGRFQEDGWEWAERILATAAYREKTADIALGLPFEERTWNLLTSLGDDVTQDYWKKVRPTYVQNVSHHDLVVRRLLEAGRPRAAMGIASRLLDKGRVRPETVVEALESAAISSDESPPHVLLYSQHKVGRLLAFARESEGIDRQRLVKLEWLYLPLLGRHGRAPSELHAELERGPHFFAEVVTWVYRAEDADDEAPAAGEEEMLRAERGRELLDSWRGLPGRNESGDVDEESLKNWIVRAREELARSRRERIGDEMIGHVLANSPTSSDGTWPCHAVCQILEDICSQGVEMGFCIATRNRRGATWRSLGGGGEQERDLAEKYRALARCTQDGYSRVTRLLTTLAESYEQDARMIDDRAELDER